jgi:MFS family permease
VWPAVLVAVIAGAIIGYAGLSFFGVAWETAIQDQVPHRSLGKVASWDQLTSFIAMPLGNVLAGPLSAAFGIDPVLVVCSLVLLGSSLAPLLARGSRELTRPEPEAAVAPPALPPEVRAETTGV